MTWWGAVLVWGFVIGGMLLVWHALKSKEDELERMEEELWLQRLEKRRRSLSSHREVFQDEDEVTR